MPFYELVDRRNCKSMGVYCYRNEHELSKFIGLFPEEDNLVYCQLNREESRKRRERIRKELENEVKFIIFELWGDLLEKHRKDF